MLSKRSFKRLLATTLCAVLVAALFPVTGLIPSAGANPNWIMNTISISRQPAAHISVTEGSISASLSVEASAAEIPVVAGQTSGFTPPEELQRQSIAPDLLTMLDGTPVTNPAQWAERRKEIRAMLEYYFYGPVPIDDAEVTNYVVNGSSNGFTSVTVKGAHSATTVNLSLGTITYPTTEMPEGGYPLILGSLNAAYHRSIGYATASLPTAITQANLNNLHPAAETTPGWLTNRSTGGYGRNAYTVEMIVRALIQETEGDGRLRINGYKVGVSGASTGGKQAAAIGAMAESVWLSLPGSGGTGGVNMYRQNSANTSWNMFSGPMSLEGSPGAYALPDGMWGPLGLAESWGGHMNWSTNFGGHYSLIPDLDANFAPVDAHFVAAMYAREGKNYFPASGISMEGTNGVPGLQQTIDLVLPVFELLGLEDHLGGIVTRQAHGRDIEAEVLTVAAVDHAEGKHADCDGECDLTPYLTGSVSENAQNYLKGLDFKMEYMHITPFKSAANAATWARIQPCCNADCDPCTCGEFCPFTADGLCCDPGVPDLSGAEGVECILFDYSEEEAGATDLGGPRWGLGWNQGAGTGTVNANGFLQQGFTNHGGGLIFTLPLDENLLGYYDQLSVQLLISAESGAETGGPIGVTFTPDRGHFPSSGNWWDAGPLVDIRMDRAFAGVGEAATYTFDLTTPYLGQDGNPLPREERGLTNFARNLSGDVYLAVGRNAYTQTMQFGYILLRSATCDGCEACSIVSGAYEEKAVSDTVVLSGGEIEITYQWYRNTRNSTVGGTPIEGATGAVFPLPADLRGGTYYYYCVLSAEGAVSVTSNVSTVAVYPESPPIPPPVTEPPVTEPPVTEPPVTETPPEDIPSEWAEETVTEAIELGIVPEALQGEYRSELLRVEFAALAVGLYELLADKEIDERGSFNDTDDINVQKLAGLGIVSGDGTGNYLPNGVFSREMAITLMYNMMLQLGHEFEAADPDFADADDISDWARPAVGALQKAGIVSGDGASFVPGEDFTREMGIVIVMNFLEVLE